MNYGAYVDGTNNHCEMADAAGTHNSVDPFALETVEEVQLSHPDRFFGRSAGARLAWQT